MGVLHAFQIGQIVPNYAKCLILMRIFFTQPAITCSKLTIETVEQGVKYVQS